VAYCLRTTKAITQSDRSIGGSLNVNGAEYNISAWIKESRKDGSKFMSLSVEPKRDKPAAPKPKQLTEDNWATEELNDDMPF
jgi:hypothetical protein